jgi:diaminopimelate decarboxylase
MNFALNSALAHFKKRNGELLIGDRTISSLAQEHGTPLYIYNRAVIKRRCQSLRDALPHNLQIYYAVKANPNSEIIKLMGNIYDGFDVASGGELTKVLNGGFDPKCINFAGPGKTPDELRYAIEQGIESISIESDQELKIIQSICNSCRLKTKVLVRINPDFSPPKSGMSMGGIPSKFGIDSECVPALVRQISEGPYISFEGIHIYNCSQNLNAEKLLNNFENIFNYALALSRLIKSPLKTINLGGGLGVPYFAHENDLDLDYLSRGLTVLFEKYANHFLNPSFIMELGRFLVGESGIYLCRVLYRKVSRGQTFLIIDGGMHHNLAATGNLGQCMVKRPLPMTIANKLNEPMEKVNIVGPLCTPIDTFGSTKLPRSKSGDFLALFQSGAYGLTASPVGFLSRDLPSELIL